MSNKLTSSSGESALQYFPAHQVDLFLFDLKNEATEHGFKVGESWNLQLATEAEMMTLRKNYHPVLSLSLQPQVLLNVYHHVKSKLQQSLSSSDVALTADELARNEKKHMAAYPDRVIR